MTALFGGGSSNQVNNTTPPASSLRIQTSVAGKAIPIIVGQTRIAPNLIDSQDFASQTVSTGGGGGGGKGLGGGGSCVGEDALISTPAGDKRLGDIVVGDVIYSLDPARGELVPGTVTHVLVHEMADSPDGMLAVEFAGRPRVLPITTNHYPWIDGVIRREMKDWTPGETLIGLDRLGLDSQVAIVSITEIEKPARTRNLVVEPHHNFFAEGVLLHNGFGGGGGKSGNSTTTYSVAPVYGICEGPVASYVQIWNGQTPQTLASLNVTGYLGGYPGDVSGYMSAHHPGNALPYAGLARAEATPMDLNTSPDLPNINFELVAAINSAISGLPDGDPSLWVTDLLTNTDYGVGYPSARLGDLSTYSAFAKANGLVVSDALTDQRALSDYFNDLLEGTYSEFVFVDGVLTIIPRGMHAVTGNGSTYTPPDVDYTIPIDEFLPNVNSTAGSSSSTSLSNDPVVWIVQRRSDLNNQITVNCLDRSNSYNPNPQQAQDLAAIEDYGLRAETPKSFTFFASAPAALTSAHYILEHEQIDKTCSFTLGMKYARVMPMSLLAGIPLPANAGTTTVRVIEITQNQDFTFSILAEEYPVGGIAPQTYNSENPDPNAPGINTPPGPINTPVLFAAPIVHASNQGLEMWAAVSGSDPAAYGGCDIFSASDSGGPYAYLTTLKGQSRMGVTTADFPVGSDPDTSHTLNVDLSESDGALEAGTHNDADTENTLCLVRGFFGDEYVSFSDATLTSSHAYALGGYVRRGQQNTKTLDHPAGAAFVRCDNAIAKIPYRASQIGQTLYLKFLAFNKFGGGGEELGDVDVVAYSVALPAPPPPPDVTGFGAAQVETAVAFAWNQVDYPLIALAGYLIGYAPRGTTTWSDFRLLTESATGTEMTNADVSAGDWTFAIRAANIAYVPGSGSEDGLSPDAAFFDLTVTNVEEVIYDNDERSTVRARDSALPPASGGWGGTLSGFIKHYTGVLIPDDQHTVSHYTSGTAYLSTALGTSPVPTPVATSTYSTGTIDTGLVSSTRTFSEVLTTLLPADTGAAAVVDYSIDDWSSGSDPNTFNPWTIGYATFRFIRGRITYSAVAGNVSFITGFTPKLDAAPSSVTADSQSISPGGTTVTFPTPFHTQPEIVVTPIGATALYATATNITGTQATIHVWNNSGVDVGGDVNYTATGE